MNFMELSKEIGNILLPIPRVWEGEKAVLEMKKEGFRHWRQMEWIGWYFQFQCEQLLSGVFEIPGPRYGNVGFDGFREIP